MENNEKPAPKAEKELAPSEIILPVQVHEEEILEQDNKPEIDPGSQNPGRLKSGKRWRYLFEFFMLFLAVFCGFIADNFREKLAERQREKEFIRSLVEDIKSDTLQSGIVLMRLQKINNGLDSVLAALSSPSVAENSNVAYRLWTNHLGLEVFVSNDRTIEQLKNNGELRLIRDKAVSNRIMEYDQVLKKYNVQSNLMYSALGQMTEYNRLFDFINLEKNLHSPVPLTKDGKNFLNVAYSRLQLWNKGLSGLISCLEDVNHEGKELVIFIGDQYNLE